MANVDITPQTRVAELLDAYPQLEPVLLSLSPAFKKLKNPVLRKTLARVATLQQVARIGNLDPGMFISRLRSEAGLADSPTASTGGGSSPSEMPPWFLEEKVVEMIDIRPMLAAGEQPMAFVLDRLQKLAGGDILAVKAPFEAAPLLDAARKKGFMTWIKTISTEEVVNYFCRL